MAKPIICIVGLGYVGLPLAHAFAEEQYDVIGYDISKRRIDELTSGHDGTGELTDAQLKGVTMRFTDDPKSISPMESLGTSTCTITSIMTT